VNRSPGAWKARHFASVIVESGPTVGMVDETMLPTGSAKNRQSQRRIFLTGRVLSFCGGQGVGGEKVEPAHA
jgi:hypothetical protein